MVRTDKFLLAERCEEILAIDEQIDRLNKRRMGLFYNGLTDGERFQLGLMLMEAKGELPGGD